MGWCEYNGVDYILDLAKNARLLRAIGRPMHEAKQQCQRTWQVARVFIDLEYRTRRS